MGNVRKDSVEAIQENMSPECIQRDTITPLGTKIHYKYKNGKFKISWGDSIYNRVSDSAYSCHYDSLTGVWDFVPKLHSETQNSLVFIQTSWTSSGGNPAPLAYDVIVLPKNNKDSIVEKEFFISCEKGYLLYGDPFEKVYLQNLENKKIQLISLNPRPFSGRSPTMSIEKTKIDKGILFIKYESLNKQKTDAIKISKRFRIEI
ncbi:MAG: hypothetical protein NTX03_06665 [Bacteroidetes bacterium]|nr:hypothetical protein [Bacteroidota bacterium]